MLRTGDFGGLLRSRSPLHRLTILARSARATLDYFSVCASGIHSHTFYEFSSVLKFIEERFGLPPLTDRDSEANDMLDSFDFDQRSLPPLILEQRQCP